MSWPINPPEHREPQGNQLVRDAIARAPARIAFGWQRKWARLADSRRAQIAADYVVKNRVWLIAALPDIDTATEIITVPHNDVKIEGRDM